MTQKKAEIFKARNDGFTIILDKEGLEMFIPHRRKALKLDGIVFCPTTNKFITGIKKICEDDPDLDGHFDGKPVYPGNCIAECANLAAAMLILLTNENLAGYPTVTDFHCECKRPVCPGDEIKINVNLLEEKSIRGQIFYSFNYSVLNSKSKIVASGELTGTAT